MKLRIALASACVVLGGLTFGAGNAQAQNVNIDSDGTVTSNCSITAPVNGVLRVATAPANPAVLNSNPATAAGATLGGFTLTCNGNATMTLGVPTVRTGSAAAATSANYGSVLKDGTTTLATVNKGGTAVTTATITGPIVSKAYIVEQWVNNGATPLPAGNYLYRVNLSVAPL